MNPALPLPAWMEHVKAHGVRRVAHSFGLEQRGRNGLSPCPACSAVTRHPSRRDKRGAVGVRPDGSGWECFECGESGDALHLASWCVLSKRRPAGAEWGDLRSACAERGLCLSDSRNTGPVAQVRTWEPLPAKQEAQPVRPNAAEVAEVWESARSVTEDAEVSAWLASRGLDAGDVEGRNLARALPEGAVLPRWARFQGHSWSRSGHRLIVPMWDASGVLASVHARNVRPDVPPGSKAASPAGAELRGLVMADALGRRMLEGTALADGLPASELVAVNGLWIMEGVPDFLTRATDYSEAAEAAPAVLSVLSGSWTAAIAERVPNGTVVAIETHLDAAGERYARTIAATLAERCRLKRRGTGRAA
jgi:hypothetical protein